MACFHLVSETATIFLKQAAVPNTITETLINLKSAGGLFSYSQKQEMVNLLLETRH